MSLGLFPDDHEPVRIAMPDSEVVLLRSLDLGAPPDAILLRLLDETVWREERVVLWGRTCMQPRLIAWHGDEGASYVYSGTPHEPRPWTGLLADLRRRVEAVAGERFNSVLLNYYRNHRDSVAMHSDDERELGAEPCIASLSLGETRSLMFRHKYDRTLPGMKLPLPSGSLLVMKGATQRCWKHGVHKLTRPCGPRVNLTFRRIHAAG